MLHGLNELIIGQERYLLVAVSAHHLARRAKGDAQGRSALADWRTGTEPWGSSYDLETLFDPIWNPRTLCGLEWGEMEPGDGPPFDGGDTTVHAPSCGNCLRIVSRDLESVAPDDRIPLIVGFVVDEVLAEAGTVVTGVPGEQLEPLRSAIRRRLEVSVCPSEAIPWEETSMLCQKSSGTTCRRARRLRSEHELRRPSPMQSKVGPLVGAGSTGAPGKSSSGLVDR